MEGDFYLKKFALHDLFGYRTLSIGFKNKEIVLIGENGYGKTMLLNAICYTLNCDFKKLCRIPFSSIELEIGEEVVCFTKEQLERGLEYDDDNVSNMYHILYTTLKSRNENESWDFTSGLLPEKSKPDFMRKLQELRKKRLEEHMELLYLPTYRRIEEDLQNIVGDDLPDKHIRDFLDEKNPNIHFGMDDVSHRINAFREKILMLSMEAFSNVSARTLEAVLNDPQEGEVNALNLSASELEAVLARMAGKINSSTRSIILSNLEGKEAGRNVLVNKFIENLVQEYDKQRYFEEQIKKFVEACNKYLFGKCFLYNPADASVKVFRKDVKGNILYDEGNIELSCFSSGEKQLVALMSCLYLEEKQKYILLYDEPETSISIFWQEELLSDIMDSGNVDQMIVVTHSPYIFKKNPEVAFGLQEFAYDRE